ncbi:hypothetical protein TRVA0_012S03246 [Trichomonascus vanleenenianus]|uniref:RNA recognition motif domain-containing protein n=1 Tax=Trichomonascus vanleenenianus TaxID=2268995 RepID=UPI003EC983EC
MSWKYAGQEFPMLYVKNLAYDVTAEELYDLFGKFGAIRQIRTGNSSTTKGTAYVVYEDMKDASAAREKLSGFNFHNRYLVVTFHSVDKLNVGKQDLEERRKNLEELKKKHNIL